MQAVYMPYRPKHTRRASDGASLIIEHSPFVSLNPQNQYSVTPCPNQSDTAVAYSKGKLSAMPHVSWDDEE